MRFLDLVESTTEQDDLLNSIEEMIVRSKARGFTQMSTPTILAKLQSMGYVLEMENLLDLLETISSVGSANKEVVKLDTSLPPSPDDEKGKEQVKKMASNQLMKGRKP